MATENIQAGARIDVTTLNAFITKVIETYFARDYVFTEMKKRGRFAFNKGGKRIQDLIEYRKMVPVPGVGYPTNTDFDESNFWMERSFPWRRWELGYKLNKFEKLAQQNTGGVLPTVLVNITKRLAEKAAKDFIDALMPTVFADGNANSTNLMGLNSWTGHTESCITDSAFLDPDDEYGGILTNLGEYSDGDWTGDYPAGTGDFSYRFNSPLLLGYLSDELTPISGGSNIWADQWESAIRHLTGYAMVLNPTPFDALVMHPQLLIDARDSLQDRTRFVAKSKPEGVSIGWNEFDFEGLTIVTQYGIPEGEAHALRFNELSLWSMQSGLVERDTDEDITESTTLVKLDSYIQMLATSPGQFGAMLPYPASGS